MFNRVDKNEKRQKRHLRSRRYIIGTAEKPRLNVYRSLANIYAQVINDETGETIAAASTVEKNLKENYGGNIEAAKAVGKAIAEKALAKGVKEALEEDSSNSIFIIGIAFGRLSHCDYGDVG